MAKISGFEELVAWQRSRALVARIYEASGNQSFGRDRDLQRQIRRAAVSILSNIAEGYERGRKAEFAHFLSIAKGSCGEVRAQLYVAMDQGYLDRPTFDELQEMSSETGRIIAGLRNSLGVTK